MQDLDKNEVKLLSKNSKHYAMCWKNISIYYKTPV